MSWIEDRLRKRADLVERVGLIRQHAIPIYDALWRQIVQFIEEAKEKGFDLHTNGALQKRIVRLALAPKGSVEFTLSLDESKRHISASGDRVDLTFELDVFPNDIVSLKLFSRENSIEEAAISILDPFLFPESQGS